MLHNRLPCMRKFRKPLHFKQEFVYYVNDNQYFGFGCLRGVFDRSMMLVCTTFIIPRYSRMETSPDSTVAMPNGRVLLCTVPTAYQLRFDCCLCIMVLCAGARR